MRALFGFALLLIFAGHLQADLRLPALFSDHMVIQADQATPVWGWGKAGEEITVSVLDEKGAEKATQTTTADNAGRWNLRLPALSAGLTGSVRVQTGPGEKKDIADVIVGEVWLGGGQSNMAYQVGRTTVPEIVAQAKEQARMADGRIRYFIADWISAEAPRDDVPGKWVVAAPDNIERCSAVAWYFGFALFQKLNRPVGLIVSSVSGTPAQAWIPKTAFDATSVSGAIWKRHEKALAGYTPEAEKKAEEELAAWTKTPASSRGARPPGIYTPSNRAAPTRLYNGMISGLGDYAIKGIIWFQADGNISFPEEYGELIQALIKAWRRQWNAELPFYYVEMNDMHEAQQIPLEVKREAMARIREQQNAALHLPKTGVVAAIDLGRVSNPIFDAHFPVKKPVGDRLANLALTEVYGLSLGEVYSPEFAGYSLEGDKVRLRFKHAGGLRASGDGTVKGFILQKPDGSWVWAEGKIENGEIVVWSNEAPKPLGVRYAWASNPVISIENGTGLPLRPFRVDLKPEESF